MGHGGALRGAWAAWGGLAGVGAGPVPPSVSQLTARSLEGLGLCCQQCLML